MDNRITQEVEVLNTIIANTKTELNNSISALDTRLTGAINKEINDRETAINNEAKARAAADEVLQSSINNAVTTINKNINSINEKLKYITQFRIGTAVPTDLPDGVVYFQYFN